MTHVSQIPNRYTITIILNIDERFKIIKMDAEYVNIKCEYKDGAFKLSYTGDDNMASYVGLLSGVSIAIEKGATLERILEFVSNMFYEIKQQNNQDNEITENIVKPKTKEELEKIIKETIEEQGNNADLNFIDTSLISDMSFLFESSDFNGDISNWDVSGVENMSYLFSNSEFNGDISQWDTSNVKDMSRIFNNSEFNGDISKWDVSNVKNMTKMFYISPLEYKYGTNGEKLKLGITESYRRRYRR